METQIVKQIKSHAEGLGSQGKVTLARIALKLGKKLDQASDADTEKLKALAKELFGKSF